MHFLKIEKLQLKNFRNLHPDIIEFDPGINCILGENGNGKTNLLEAVYFLRHRKSFRKNTSFPQLLSIDGENFEIYFSAVFKSDENKQSFYYSGKLASHATQWHFNGQTIKKKLSVPIVLINPFDAHSFYNLPQFRRQWFDEHIGFLNPLYRKTHSRYQSSLKFKNALLQKRPKEWQEQLMAINAQLAKHSFLLLQGRKEFLKSLENNFSAIFREIFSEHFHLQVENISKFLGMTEQEIYLYLQSKIPEDITKGFASCGVHKDDYTLLIDGLNSLEYSSLGQQKMSYLSLIFAYIELFRYKFNSYPIVLIDDISGELDRRRWQMLINYLQKREFQVLITTANENFRAELEKIEKAKRFYISSGKVITKT